ncbi:hypothetical protein M9H77_12378 [Catharanthus roseus]|uniref:Uncharacterized protein n=1 Tax=Catharanthus roseus TaxID=4058 RepID=A0ACC0BH86_CATRO|nr:hypothetical protein M9H77_12378 [Catharanthus roseus]
MGVLDIGLYVTNEPTLNFETSTNLSYPIALEIISYFEFFIAFDVKLPIIPLHTWLLYTHREAHYSTCMLLVETLLKLGAYGLVQINIELLLSHAHYLFFPWLVIVGTIQIIYAISTSLGQWNFKKRNSLFFGLNGALSQIISHGFIGVALFFLAGTTYDRTCLFYLDKMHGIAITMPKLFTIAIHNVFSFVAELIVFWGIITSHKYFLMPKILITFVVAIGMLSTPIYSLSMSRQMFMDTSFLTSQTIFFFIIIMTVRVISFDSSLLPILGIGMYPNFVISLSIDKVEVILSNSFSK